MRSVRKVSGEKVNVTLLWVKATLLCYRKGPHSDLSLWARSAFHVEFAGTVLGIRKTFKMSLEVRIVFFKAKRICQLCCFYFYVIGNLCQGDLSNKTKEFVHVIKKS